jgi:hypothetical protein
MRSVTCWRKGVAHGCSNIASTVPVRPRAVRVTTTVAIVTDNAQLRVMGDAVREALQAFDQEYAALSLHGRKLAEFALEWIEAGVRAKDVEDWLANGFWYPKEVTLWASSGVSPAVASHCVNSGISVEEFLAGAVIKDDVPEVEGSSGGTDVVTAESLRLLEILVAQLGRALDENTWHLEAERFTEVDVLTKILQLQLHSPKPRRSIIKMVLETLGAVAVGVVGNVVYTKLIGEM